MSEFSTYLKLGFEHIVALNAYDHLLFVISLCAIYKFSDWRKIAVLITAFTIGHSITLALATFNMIKINSNYVEFLIPVTILITCISNFFHKIQDRKPLKNKKNYFRYFMALFFGLIHGLGFSNYLRSLLGKAESITMPLFAFNIGLELGQLLIVGITILIISLLLKFTNMKQQELKIGISGIIAGMTLFLIKNSSIFS
jgi:hypothetical protein